MPRTKPIPPKFPGEVKRETRRVIAEVDLTAEQEEWVRTYYPVTSTKELMAAMGISWSGLYKILDILPRLKPRNSWVLTPPHGYLSRLPRLTRTPQRGNALPQNVVSSMQVAVVVAMTHRTSPLPIMQ